VPCGQVKDLMFFLEAQKTIEDSAEGEVLPTQNPARYYLPRTTHLESGIAPPARCSPRIFFFFITIKLRVE